MGSEDTLFDYSIWRKKLANYEHDIRVLDVNINTLQKELIEVIHLPNLPKYLVDKKEELIRYQLVREELKRINIALKRNTKGVESQPWFKKQNMKLRKSNDY